MKNNINYKKLSEMLIHSLLYDWTYNDDRDYAINQLSILVEMGMLPIDELRRVVTERNQTFSFTRSKQIDVEYFLRLIRLEIEKEVVI